MKRTAGFMASMAEFDSLPATLLAAANRKTREAPATIGSYAFSPFSFEGLAEAIGFHRDCQCPLAVSICGIIAPAG